MIDVHVCNENPLCSLSYDAPVAQFFIDVLDLRRFVINSGAYGGPSLKDLEMRTSLPRKTTRRFFCQDQEGRNCPLQEERCEADQPDGKGKEVEERQEAADGRLRSVP